MPKECSALISSISTEPSFKRSSFAFDLFLISILFKTIKKFLFIFRIDTKRFISSAVSSSEPSINNNIRFESSAAIRACSVIAALNSVISEPTPPVSTTKYCWFLIMAQPKFLSLVSPEKSETIAFLVFVSLLNKEDFPTLGRPRIAIEFNFVRWHLRA